MVSTCRSKRLPTRNVHKNLPTRNLHWWLVAISGVIAVSELPTHAQSITTTPTDQGTVINQSGGTYTITGGRQIGANLFHDFQGFGLKQGEVANFLANLSLQNIFADVSGGNASVINGLIQVTGGNSNLFLRNPAGVIFGPSAQLNVPAAFFPSPLPGPLSGLGLPPNGLGLPLPGNQPAPGVVQNLLAVLTQQPGVVLSFRNSIATATSSNRAFLNASNKPAMRFPQQFAPGEPIALTGQMNVNGLTVTALPAQNLMRLSQAESPLSLEIQPPTVNGRLPSTWSLPIVALPQLLTGGSGSNATDVAINSDGTVQLIGAGINIPTVAGAFAIATPRSTQTNTPPAPSPSPARETDKREDKVSSPLPEIPPLFRQASRFCIDRGITATEAQLSQPYQYYLGLSSTQTSLDTCNILNTIQKQTGIKTAILYGTFKPTSLKADPARDQLELILISSDGAPLRKRIPAATRLKVVELADAFRREVSDPSKTDSESYKESAQQLYRWLITPIEADLKADEIQNITFILDTELSTLPLAALYDNIHHQFLIQKFNIGLMPSLSLTDTRYVNIRKTQVLAMGRSTFTDPDQAPLPAVPIELALITTKLWQGQRFLNQQFTLNNLIRLHQQNHFGIIHLATHGEFKPGEQSLKATSKQLGAGRVKTSNPQSQVVNDSYIQLWDTKLRLHQLRQLKLNDPPIELLVLSACRTALGDRDTELGFAGLAVQFGVKSALASLWYVSDAGTLGLVVEFYQQLRNAPIKAEALRQAQLAMLNHQVQIQNGELLWTDGRQPLSPQLPQTADLSHPYYWAGFTLVGNPW